MGDNWKGYRIVGTSYDYLKHFDKIDQGRLWNDDFEMIAGADIDVKINQNIIGAHGLIDGGGVHDEHTYKIVGSLKPSGSVVDRLLLTSVNSVLEIHGLEDIDHHTEHNHDHKSDKKIATNIMSLTEMKKIITRKKLKIIMKSMLMNIMIIIIQIKMNITSIKNLKMSILIKKT